MELRFSYHLFGDDCNLDNWP
ncbi:hypothetical protein C5167_042430 [Papaver somniferum]|uniref:Uncharacterized protein n=1 Tax=Papaver somniferum TaxID=3469 RepID=A0A4Y7L602_PAPSO|nr:hypothetical protein C5167_042430 [Papaver somniferum]